MPAPLVTNAVLYLDDVTEFNGPMVFVPGTHRLGVIATAAAADDATSAKTGSPAPRPDGPAWLPHVSARLKHSLTSEMVGPLVRERGLVSSKAPAGSVVFFHPNLVHASGNNLSPFDRRLVLVTYNSVHNLPIRQGARRPEFLVSTDTRPLTPLEAASPVNLDG